MIPVREVSCQDGCLAIAGGDDIAVSPYSLPYIGIFLVRHDAASCSKTVRKTYECEIRAAEKAAVLGEMVQSAGYLPDGRGKGPLGFPSSHLCRYRVERQCAEPKHFRGVLSVQREGTAITGGASQGVLVCDFVSGGKHCHVIHQRLCVRSQPQPE